jgi:mono/diheme cytochrome c family protein
MFRNIHAALAACALALASAVPVAAAADDAAQLARGKYLVTIGGCNDCHTPGYLEAGGRTPERDWLTGSPVGYQGPWGTSYASNLRLVMAGMSEAEWRAAARRERLPPMPWFNLREMTDGDLAAVYAYVRSLGPAGRPAPAYVAPGGRVSTPYFVFVPQSDPRQAAR